MARYIDADELYKATQKRIAEANEARMAVVDDEFLDLINDAFTEDVAPRAEVAKGIFEEIKDQLRGIFDFFRQDNDIRESCAIMFAISEVDKIEKKYTQSEPPKGD